MNNLWSRLKRMSLGMETTPASTGERFLGEGAAGDLWLGPLGSEGKTGGADLNERLESHSKWLNEYLCVGDFGGSAEIYVGKVLQSIKLSEEEESMCRRRVTDLCYKLNFAVLYAYIGDFDYALKFIKVAKDELEFHVGLKEMEPSISHINAYEYAIQACTVAVLWQFLKKHELLKINVLDFERQIEELNGRWKKLDEDSSSQAVIIFCKACLASSIRLPDEFVLEKLKLAVALEPCFHGWYRYLYRKLRQIRRTSASARPNYKPTMPTDEEKSACKTAYVLRPDIGDNIANMANMLEEGLNSTKKTMSKEQIKEQLDALVGLLKMSVSLNVDPWVKIRLAEIVGYGNYELDALEGDKLFKECLDQWPLNSMVWHKAGKFYHLGGNPRGGGRFVDADKACSYYQNALNLSPSNFPCLMDYLKLLVEPLNQPFKIPFEIDKYLPNVGKEIEFRKLVFIKGMILWMHNTSEFERLRACSAWLEIIEKYPNSVDDVAKCFRQHRMEIVGLVSIDIDEVVAVLSKSTEVNSTLRYQLIAALKNQNPEGTKESHIRTDVDNDNVDKVDMEIDSEDSVSQVACKVAPVYTPRGRGREQTRGLRGCRKLHMN